MGRTVAVGAAAVLIVSAVSCGHGGAEETENSGPLRVGEEGYDRELAERMSERLIEVERDALAEYVLDEENTTFTLLDTPYLEEWEIYEVFYFGAVSPQFWEVAISEEGATSLTGFPAGFALVLEFDSGRIVDTDMALVVARDYITMTTPGDPDFPPTILNSVEDIEVGPRSEEYFPMIREEFGDVIEPPQVTQDADDVYTVVVHTLHKLKIQRRTITFGTSGEDMTDDTEELSDQLINLIDDSPGQD